MVDAWQAGHLGGAKRWLRSCLGLLNMSPRVAVRLTRRSCPVSFAGEVGGTLLEERHRCLDEVVRVQERGVPQGDVVEVLLN